jgi:hypothetical protein
MMTNTPPAHSGFAIDPGSAPINADDRVILGQVDAQIAMGRELKAWWTENRDTRVWMNRVPIARQVHQPGTNYGFLMDAHLKRGTLPVAGVVQDQAFRWPKLQPSYARDHPQWMKEQLRAFVLKYFMRMAGTLPPRTGTAGREGWGYRQMYYKLAATGAIGKFPKGQQTLIVPLDDVGSKYSWIVFLVKIHQFDISFSIPGVSNWPNVTLSMTQPVHTVMTPDFLLNEDSPEPGVLGRYGYGYSVVPDLAHRSAVTAGPSTITNTIEMLSFRVLDTGEVRAHMVFITPQPPRIVDPVLLAFDVADRLSFGTASKMFDPVKTLLEQIEPDVDPIYFSIDLLNTISVGLAAQEFGLSRQNLFRKLMNLHFTDVYKMFNLAASHFAMVNDWTDPSRLPGWVAKGVYAPPGEPS